MTTNQTPTPDETVTRLAEAMSSEFPDAYGNAYRHWAEVALRAIAADPSLAGFPAHVASEWDYGIPVTSPIILLPDPEPPAPEFPSVIDEAITLVAMAAHNYETAKSAGHNLDGWWRMLKVKIDHLADAAAEAGRSQE